VKKIIIPILITLGVAIGIIILIIVSIFYIGSHSASEYKKNQAEDSITFSNQAPKEYLEVLKGHDSLILQGTYHSKTRNPISVFHFKDLYILIEYKLPTENNQALNKIITEEFLSNTPPDGVSYWSVFGGEWIDDKNNPYNITYKCGKPLPTHKIYISLATGSTHISKKNDSTVTYLSNLGNFSIRYGEDEAPDFYGDIKYNLSKSDLPIQITFHKHQSYIYLIMIILKK